MDQELVAYLDRLSQQIEGLRGEMLQQTEGLREENRQTRVVMEGMRSDTQLLAEAVMATREQFGRHQAHAELQLNEIRAFLPLPYRELDERVAFLEARVEREGRDALEVFRERFGRRQG